MNNAISKFLLLGDKFMPEIHLRQPQFTKKTKNLIVLVDHLLGMKKEFKSLKKLAIQTMCSKMN